MKGILLWVIQFVQAEDGIQYITADFFHQPGGVNS